MPGSVQVNPTQPALAEPEGRATPIWDRYPKSQRLAINLTLRCNIACAHCIVESSPRRRETLTGDEVRTALLDGRRRGKRHVTFSGGEVFLHAPMMCEAIAFATDHGYVVDVETNAFWAKTAAAATARLKPFVDAGISGLSLSADAYHVKYFPVDRPINAARAARSYGLVTEMNFCPSSEADVDAAIIAALNEAGEPYIHNELLDRGRGRDLVPIGEARAVEDLPDCDSLTRTVHATADVYACCELDISTDALKRTPAFLGSLRGDDETLDAPGRSRAPGQRVLRPRLPHLLSHDDAHAPAVSGPRRPALPEHLRLLHARARRPAAGRRPVGRARRATEALSAGNG